MSLCRGINVVLVVGMLLGTPAGAWANELTVSTGTQSGYSESYVNVRGGVTGVTTPGRPTLCLEVSPFGPLSVEACGLGAGFLSAGPGAELTHFRGKWTAHVWQIATSHLALKPGLGVAELQLSPDASGVWPGEPRAAAVEVFGPEASLSLQWQQRLFSGVELVGDLSVGLGWFQNAPELRIPREKVQPFVDLTLGVGW